MDISFLTAIAVCVISFWIGFAADRSTIKRAGVIQIERAPSLMEHGKVTIMFSKDIEELYSDKWVLFQIDVLEPQPAGPDAAEKHP